MLEGVACSLRDTNGVLQISNDELSPCSNQYRSNDVGSSIVILIDAPKARAKCQRQIADAHVCEQFHILSEASRCTAFDDTACVKQLGLN